MGRITSTVGLISGINTKDLIDQLIAVEARPKQLVQQRNAILQAQQVAYQEINAKLLALKFTAAGFTENRIFRSTAASSSNEMVLTANSTNAAVPGTYNFTVRQLVGSQQTITNGFLDTTATAFAPQGTTLTFDRGGSRLDSQTRLSQLNGGMGIQRGLIRITDRSGASATIDLSDVVTVTDVLDRINAASGISVFASVDGDAIRIEDASGAATVNLTVSNVGLSGTASSLGIAGSVAASTLTGEAVNRLGRDTLLTTLNDGNGVGQRHGVNDFRITSSAGVNYDINLDGIRTLGELVDKINETTGGNVTASFRADGAGLLLADHTGSGSTFAVTALGNSRAARDLGLLQNDADGNGQIEGHRILAGLNSKLLRNLNGGQGVAGLAGSTQVTLTSATAMSALLNGAGISGEGSGANDLKVTARDGSVHEFNLDSFATVGDFISAVNATGKLTLSLDGQALRLSDVTGSSGTLTVENLNGSTAGTQLGLIVDGNVQSIRGANLDPAGAAPTDALIRLTNRNGVSTDVNLAGAESVSDVIARINAAGAGITASLNTAGNGILLTDTTGGSGSLSVSDVSGTAAASLGLTQSVNARMLDSGNRQFRYISEATRIDQLGITRGQFKLTDSNGASATVDLTQGNELTLADVIGEINSRGLAIQARINDTGDGLLLVDTGGGAVPMKVEEEGSTTARDLGILQTAATAGGNINGSFEKTVTIDGTDTLNDVVRKINEAGVGVAATIVNDGSAGAPYRLSLSARTAGTRGAFVFDSGGVNLTTTDIARAQDAVVFFGDADPAKALLVTSTSNSLDSIIPGASVTLKSASATPVQVTINRDDSAIIDQVKTFVTNFNAAVDTIHKHGKYDQETEQRGVLLGDSTVARVQNQLFSLVNNRNSDLTSQFSSLAQIGITVGEGAKLQFNEEKFAQALASNPQAVEQLFTFKETLTDPDTGARSTGKAGIGVRISEYLDRLTDSVDGIFKSRVDTLQGQVKLNNDRIAALDIQLEQKRARLEMQFLAMERALADMQRQSNALEQFQPIQPWTGSRNNSSGSNR